MLKNKIFLLAVTGFMAYIHLVPYFGLKPCSFVNKIRLNAATYHRKPKSLFAAPHILPFKPTLTKTQSPQSMPSPLPSDHRSCEPRSWISET